MKLFSAKLKKLSPIYEENFKLEKDLQKLVESNIKTLFSGFQFVKTEFSFSGQHKEMRIDTLAYDTQSKAFVIIEYKRGKSFSVIDQGYAYLSAMLNKSADFVLAYNNKFKTNFAVSDINWNESKVYFISPEFTAMQKESVSFKDLPIFLWEVKKYKSNIISLNRVGISTGTAQIASISSKYSKSKSVQTQVKTYTETDLISKSKEHIKELYFELKDALQDIANFEIKITKLYTAFILNGSNVIDIEPIGNSLKVFLNAAKEKLKDPYGITRDISKVGHHGNGDYLVELKNSEKLNKLIELVKSLINN